MATSTRPAPPDEAQEQDSPAEAVAAPTGVHRTFPLSLAVILVPASVGLMRLLIGLHRPFAHAGDAAVLETAVRRVATGTQTLGPYSRFGFHQLGPSYFFVQAPFSWLTGGSPRSLFIGALVINLGAAAACVAVVRRQLGEPAARWSAVVIVAYLLALTPALTSDPWNPYVLGTPLLLTILLAARAAAGSWLSAAWAMVSATFVVQTHLGAGITLVALFGLASVVAVVGWKHRDRPAQPGHGRRRWVAFGLAAVLLGLFWIPPLVEQATHSPGNVTLLARFFRDSHPEFDATVDHSLGTASEQVAAELAAVLFGRPGADGNGEPAENALAAIGVLAAVVATAVGWRRRNLFLASLGVLSLGACGAAIWSTTRVVGEVLPYLVVWTGVLLLPVWIAAGLLVRRQAPRLLAVSVGLLGAILAWSMLRAPLPPVGDSPDVRTVTALARPWLAARGAHQVRIRIGEHDGWPLAAGLINELERDGIDVTVDREWASLFGDQFAPTEREAAEVWVTGATATAPTGRAQRLGAVGAASLWAGTP